jgi:hypothetical protein
MGALKVREGFAESSGFLEIQGAQIEKQWVFYAAGQGLHREPLGLSEVPVPDGRKYGLQLRRAI